MPIKTAANWPMAPSISQFISMSLTPQPRTRGKFGCELYFWLIGAAAAGGFYYVMHQWHTSPRETLQRLVTSAQEFLQPREKPAPEPEDEEEETQQPAFSATPRP